MQRYNNTEKNFRLMKLFRIKCSSFKGYYGAKNNSTQMAFYLRKILMKYEEKSKNPVEIFNNIAKREFIRIHGPEHHVLDGAALLTAFYNAGGNIDLYNCLKELMKRGLQMPGATCGMWGVCGAVSSMGAALFIIDKTGPVSSDKSWGKHLASYVFESYSAGTEIKPQINRDAVRIMKELYGIDMEQTQYSKLISEIPNPDIAISMGCNVGCPF